MRPLRDMEAEDEVVALIEEGLASTGKKLVELADELGYSNPNFLSNLRKKVSRVPLSKAVDLARSLDLDPQVFCNTCFRAYMPELKDFMQYAVGTENTTKEKKLIAMMRKKSSLATFGPRNQAQWDELRELMGKW